MQIDVKDRFARGSLKGLVLKWLYSNGGKPSHAFHYPITPTVAHIPTFRSQMNLYFSPNDPGETMLVSDDGIVHYKIVTAKRNVIGSCARTIIERPEEVNGSRAVAVIKWRRWSHPSVMTHIFDGIKQEMDLREFLYKLGGKFTG